MSKVFRKYGIFLIIPGIMLGLSVFLRLAAGPYWLAPNFDPAYQYLINGLYLLKGIVPNHTDHPGTPLQMLCAAVCWLLNMGQPVSEVVRRVLISPEFYLDAVWMVLSLFFFSTSIALAVYVYRKTDDKLAAFLTQLPALGFLALKSWETLEPVLPVVANVDPEPLLMSVGNLFALCLWMNFFARTAKGESLTALLWAMVTGLGVAVKLTFIPLAIIPLIVLSWKNKIIFLCVVMASFVLWTLPIISKYAIVWGWISGVATHTGSDQSGWKSIVTQEGLLVCFILAALAMVFFKAVNKKWDRGSFFLLAVTMGIVFQFAAVARHPGAHYLLPGLGLSGSLLVLFYLQDPASHLLGRRITVGFVIVITLLGIFKANEYRVQLQGLTRDIIDFEQHLASTYPNSIFIDYYRSSSPEAALFFGDGWNLSPHLGDELARLYPDKFYFHIWGNCILSFAGRVWSNDLLAQGTTVVLRGDGNFDFSNSPYVVQLLEKGRFESAELLTGTTEKQAAILMAGAVQLIQSGQYPKAMACLLQARRFHYQPDATIDSLIKIIGPRLQ